MKFKTLLNVLVLLLIPAFSIAKSPYAPVIQINGSAVTGFEVEQRALMLLVLGTIGDVQKQALQELIDDRLKFQAGRSLGLSVSEEELTVGMTEYAKRANLTPEKFIEVLAIDGIYAETFTDFIKSGLIWRKIIQQLFIGKAFITEAELDTALALGTTSATASILLSEILLPFSPETKNDTLELLLDLRNDISNLEDFDFAALTYSAAPSRANSGLLEWSPLAVLPKAMQTQMMTMGVGQMTQPILMPGAYLMYQLRGIRNNRTVAAKTIAYDYATLQIPGGRSDATFAKAAKLRSSVDTCNDLLAESDQYPSEYFSQQVLPVRNLPKHISIELAKLDANEISTNLTQGENGEFLTFLMLCGRVSSLAEGQREQVRETLFTQRLEAFGDGYLQELKGDAIILRP